MLSVAQADKNALFNRVFTPAHVLKLYEKDEPLASISMRIVDQYGGEPLSEKLRDSVSGIREERQIFAGRVVAPLANPETAN